MKQSSSQKFLSECGKIVILADNDTPLGVLHDFLMLVKGFAVEKMVAAQKLESEASEKQKELEKPENAE